LSTMMDVAVDFGHRRVQPYVIAGIGFTRHTSSYASPNYKAELTGGGGAKIFLSRQIFVSPEIRAGGGPPFVRSAISLGLVLR
jgi:hypothetical protein